MQPQGTASVDRTWHVGTGHRSGEQSPGLVVCVTVGHGVVECVGRGSVTMLVMTPVGVDDDDVVVVRRLVGVEVVGCQCHGEEVVVVVGMVGQGSGSVRKSMLQPWYGQSASQGAMSVAVARGGQPQGLMMVV